MNILYITLPLNGLLMIALPFIFGFIVTRKFHLRWGLFFIGAATFVFSQVGHIPFNGLVGVLFQRGILPAPPDAWKLPFNAAFGGLSAGLWEEWARYAMYRWWAKDARSWPKGVLLGAGHGGIEALILGVLVLIGVANMMVLNSIDLARVLPPEQLAKTQSDVAAYWATPWPLTLMGAVERLLTIPLHITFSVIVLQTFLRKQIRWTWLAVLWHALVDGVLVYAAGLMRESLGVITSAYLTEGVIAILTAISIAILFALRRPELDVVEAAPAATSPAGPVSPLDLPPVEATPESLDRTRYN